MTDFQIALNERDQIIKELTESLKQSIERNEKLASETKQFKETTAVATNTQRKWFIDKNEQRLSETTIDLVSESEFEDDELNRRARALIKNQCSSVEEFKSQLSNSEIELFACIETKFEHMLDGKINALNEKLQQEQIERAELDTELKRLRQLVVNIKGGSVEVNDLRVELEKIHKMEMEKLRLYFERKCTDLEKQ